MVSDAQHSDETFVSHEVTSLMRPVTRGPHAQLLHYYHVPCAALSIPVSVTEFSHSLKGSHTMIEWDLFLGRKVSSVITNQSM